MLPLLVVNLWLTPRNWIDMLHILSSWGANELLYPFVSFFDRSWCLCAFGGLHFSNVFKLLALSEYNLKSSPKKWKWCRAVVSCQCRSTARRDFATDHKDISCPHGCQEQPRDFLFGLVRLFIHLSITSRYCRSITMLTRAFGRYFLDQWPLVECYEHSFTSIPPKSWKSCHWHPYLRE